MGDENRADSYGFTTTERGSRRRKPLPHCGCTVPCQRSFTCLKCQHVRPYCFGAGDSDECDACWGEQERADALTAARAEGYAEGRAAERADMLAFVEEACRLGTQGDALLRALMAKGKHDGAAAIWHSKGYAEAVADVVAHVNASHPSWKRLDDSASGPRVNFVLGLLVADLNAGAHVGAAKKGGAP